MVQIWDKGQHPTERGRGCKAASSQLQIRVWLCAPKWADQLVAYLCPPVAGLQLWGWNHPASFSRKLTPFPTPISQGDPLAKEWTRYIFKKTKRCVFYHQKVFWRNFGHLEKVFLQQKLLTHGFTQWRTGEASMGGGEGEPGEPGPSSSLSSTSPHYSILIPHLPPL